MIDLRNYSTRFNHQGPLTHHFEMRVPREEQVPYINVGRDEFGKFFFSQDQTEKIDVNPGVVRKRKGWGKGGRKGKREKKNG